MLYEGTQFRRAKVLKPPEGTRQPKVWITQVANDLTVRGLSSGTLEEGYSLREERTKVLHLYVCRWARFVCACATLRGKWKIKWLSIMDTIAGVGRQREKLWKNLEVRFSLAEDKAPFYSAADRFSRYLFVCSILVMNCLI